jgi:hypothetical protein
MKNLTLVTILTITVFAFVNCGETTTNTKNAATNNSAVVNNTADKRAANNTTASDDNASKMSDEEMEKAMSEDISAIDASNPMPAGELYKVFTANESAGKGKKLAVKGTYTAYATSSSVINPQKPAYRFELKGENGGVACVVKNRPKETEEISKAGGDKDKILTVKGVARTTVDGISGAKMVALEPCEIVKLEIK